MPARVMVGHVQYARGEVPTGLRSGPQRNIQTELVLNPPLSTAAHDLPTAHAEHQVERSGQRCTQQHPFRNSSWMATPRAAAMAMARRTRGSLRPRSMLTMVWRLTPSSRASASCERPKRSRCSFTLDSYCGMLCATYSGIRAMSRVLCKALLRDDGHSPPPTGSPPVPRRARRRAVGPGRDPGPASSVPTLASAASSGSSDTCCDRRGGSRAARGSC